jgi:uncharacterized C2H2 Zn-finger protein
MSELRRLQEHFMGLAEEETREVREADGPIVSEERTPYMVRCPTHGQVYLTNKGYTQQMMAANSLWKCPHCGLNAYWDNDNYDEMMG